MNLPDILGLGYAEANSSFISIPEALVEAGTIKSPAFSIYAEKPIYFPHTQTREEGDRGTLLFGGVNKSKYNGTLHTLPIVENSADGRKAFRVNMTGFSVNEKSMLSDTLPVQALLNPSLSYTYVPESIAERIWSALGITQFPIFGPASVPCNASSSNTTLRFEFGSAKFELDVGLFIETRSVLNRKDFCILNIIAATDANEDIVLGANFLQQLYTVYDMGRDEISLAERNWESSEDEILEITRKDGATGGTSEENKGDADDSKAKVESEDKKSVGALVGNSTGLQISFSIFLLWAFFG